MFRRTICAMTAWAGLSGAVNAQQPDLDPPLSGASASPAEPGPYLPNRGPRAARLARPLAGATPLSGRQTEFASEMQQVGQVTSPSDAIPPPRPAPTAAPAAAPNMVNAPYAGAAPRFSRSGAPSGRIWTNVEWLVWATSGQHVPAAITTSPLGTPQGLAGVLTTPGTANLFPRDRANNEFRSGFRLTAGYWFDDSQMFGIEGDFFFLGNSKKGRTVSSDAAGVPIIARPFENALTGLSASSLVAYPGIIFGTAGVRAENSAIGGGVSVLYDLLASPCARLNVVLGYRFLGVSDEVSIEEDSTTLVPLPGIAFATRTQLLDRFTTQNNFNGFVMGLNGERKFGFWYVGGKATLAIGGVQQIVTIDGRTVITQANGQSNATFQGLYTQSSNIGRHTRNDFAVLPEIGLRFGVQLTESARIYVGYNWMYLSSVVRAGDQIDTRVNTGFLPPGNTSALGPPLPAFQFRTTDYWLQGVSFGMEVKF